ncbi:MAG: type II secretion system protein [Clostridia bacterium]|nr:type II secretion system protein [Clostridia bacterium]
MKKNNKKGFTLVELVIVVAVMAILVAVAIPTVSSITDKATKATNESNAKTIQSMIKLEVAEKGATATVDADLIKDALDDAKLGISGNFWYDVDSGAVLTSAGGDFAIVLDHDNADTTKIVTVSAYSAKP